MISNVRRWFLAQWSAIQVVRYVRLNDRRGDSSADGNGVDGHGVDGKEALRELLAEGTAKDDSDAW